MKTRIGAGIFLRALMALFVAYCVVTTIRLWIFDSIALPQIREGAGYLLMACSISLSILRRWLPLRGRIFDMVHETIVLGAHILSGIEMHRAEPPPSTPPPEAS
jgi:hypothetical protein